MIIPNCDTYNECDRTRNLECRPLASGLTNGEWWVFSVIFQLRANSWKGKDTGLSESTQEHNYQLILLPKGRNRDWSNRFSNCSTTHWWNGTYCREKGVPAWGVNASAVCNSTYQCDTSNLVSCPLGSSSITATATCECGTTNYWVCVTWTNSTVRRLISLSIFLEWLDMSATCDNGSDLHSMDYLSCEHFNVPECCRSWIIMFGWHLYCWHLYWGDLRMLCGSDMAFHIPDLWRFFVWLI